MRRYLTLPQTRVRQAVSHLIDGLEGFRFGLKATEFVDSLLTRDERIKIGRRLEVAWLLSEGLSYREIRRELRVGFSTISLVEERMCQYPHAFEKIVEGIARKRRSSKVQGWGRRIPKGSHFAKRLLVK